MKKIKNKNRGSNSPSIKLKTHGFLKIPITKWNSSGNTFILLSGQRGVFSNSKKKLDFVKRVCALDRGLGANGCLILIKKKSILKWEFFNSDGSSAEMCGNAARAADSYARGFLGIKRPIIEHDTLAGRVKTWKVGSRVAVKMPNVFEYANSRKSMRILSAGVPHIVVARPNLENLTSLRARAKGLRYKKFDLQEGFNITFLLQGVGSKISAVTFERGVEDFTKACGTGAVAAGYSEFLRTGIREFRVKMPGGELQVQFPGDQGSALLIGESELICKAEFPVKR